MYVLQSKWTIVIATVSFIPIFVFFFGHFWRRSYENTKILRNLCLHFARLDGQDWKKWKENHETKMTIIPKYVSIEWTKHKKLSTVQSGDFHEIFSHQLHTTDYVHCRRRCRRTTPTKPPRRFRHLGLRSPESLWISLLEMSRNWKFYSIQACTTIGMVL